MDPDPPRRPSFGWHQLRELDDGEGFEASHGNLQLALAHPAQGCDGDYDSGNPGDVPLMRYPFSGRSSPDAQWTELEDGDYLTDLSAGAPWRELAACARCIFQKVVDDIMAQGGSYRGCHAGLGAGEPQPAGKPCHDRAWACPGGLRAPEVVRGHRPFFRGSTLLSSMGGPCLYPPGVQNKGVLLMACMFRHWRPLRRGGWSHGGTWPWSSNTSGWG